MLCLLWERGELMLEGLGHGLVLHKPAWEIHLPQYLYLRLIK